MRLRNKGDDKMRLSKKGENRLSVLLLQRKNRKLNGIVKSDFAKMSKK